MCPRQLLPNNNIIIEYNNNNIALDSIESVENDDLPELIEDNDFVNNIIEYNDLLLTQPEDETPEEDNENNNTTENHNEIYIHTTDLVLIGQSIFNTYSRF